MPKSFKISMPCDSVFYFHVELFHLEVYSRIQQAVMSLFGTILIILMGLIVTQVICSALDINPIKQFQSALPFLGKALSLNSLLDLQWHILLILGLMPIGIVWTIDRHVRVDFIYQRFGSTGKRAVDLLGNLLFSLPFLVLSIPAAWSFFQRAWLSDEGSANGGLNDLWLIKGLIPLGLLLLAIAIVLECVHLLKSFR